MLCARKKSNLRREFEQ
uniref:Uncharacterized protein n=1 Tax=Arundo donax TaxID=35708 RepID=A0A0A9LRF3_ARUDO